MSRQIVLDTETTGLEVSQGHRIIEIGCVELKSRRLTQGRFHHYVNPERAVDPGAQQVHGISTEFLADKPKFTDVARSLWDFLEGAELLIHNAPFDLGFLNDEFRRLGYERRVEDICTITDTVTLARKLHPGQKNSLDALCKRYGVDNSRREFHGALLDAHLLADVYLAMTGGQGALVLDADAGAQKSQPSRFAEKLSAPDRPLPLIAANADEMTAHQERLKKIASKGRCLWDADLPQPR